MAGKRQLATVPAEVPSKLRCAVYTRKSTDEGLESGFSSLDAQREAGEAYVGCQRLDGWVLLPDRYDDGGYTGANMERPGLKTLLADIEADKVDCVVVYKVDRFSRSLLDFMKMMEILDKHGVTFVSVTQPFNTTTSPGRLLLNMLFSFAQFEREMISERTRDKMRAARRKGRWTGGNPVLGYDVAPKGGALVINPDEANQVREIFRMYLELGSLIPVVRELDNRGWTLKASINRDGRRSGGARFTKATLHSLLSNVIYTGRVKHAGELYAGEHERVVEDSTWNAVQVQLKRNGRTGGGRVPNKHGGLLKGLVKCASCKCGMTHTYTQKKDKPLYRYYLCINAHQRGWNTCETRSVSAPELEGAVVEHIRGFVRQPMILSEVLRQIEQERQQDAPTTFIADPADVRNALMQFDPLWAQLNIWEQEQFIRTLVKEVRYDGPTQRVTVSFLSEGIQAMCKPVDLITEQDGQR